MREPNRYAVTRLQLILSMVVFGTIGIFVRRLPYSSGVIAMVRGLIGALYLIVFRKLGGHAFSYTAVRRNALLLFLSGAFIGINWILLFEAYRFTTVATATLCYYLAPVFVIIASPFVFRERITPLRIIAVLLALLGMILVSGVYQDFGKRGTNSYGILLGVGAALFYASVMTLNKKLRAIDAYDQTIVQLLVAGSIMLPYCLFTHSFDHITVVTDSVSILLLLVVGIVHTGMTYALYFGAMQKLPAQTIAIFSYIDPVVAIFVSALLLRERMDIFGVLGAILILGSTLLTEWKPKQRNVHKTRAKT